MVTTEPAVASARLLHLNYFLAKCCACSTKILFDSCRVFLKHLFSHPASRASLCLLGLGGEMEALPKSRPTFAEVAAGQSSGLVNLVFSRQTVIFFRMHRFIDKPIVITEPAVASIRLLGLGSKLYPSNMRCMLNKDLIWFMQSFSSILFLTLWAEPPPFVFLNEEEKRRLRLNCIKPLRSPQPEPITQWVYSKIQYSSDQCHSLIFYIQFASDLSSSSKLF